MKIEVSNGEIVDKHTILAIKLKKIKDEEKLKNVKKEYDILSPYIDEIRKEIPMEFEILYNDLIFINNRLWNIEDEIRKLEKEKTFNQRFIDLARGVYRDNDMRAKVKREINHKTNSEIIEEKYYVKY